MEQCNPDDGMVREKLIYSYLKNHSVKEARAEAENAARGTSSERTVYVAHILNSNGDFAGAQTMLKQLIDSGSDTADVHAELGRAYLGQNKYEESVRELGAAVQLDPATESYTIDLASALLSWGNYPTALKFLEAVRDRFGNSPKYLYDQAWAYYGLRQTAHTIAILQALLQKEPNWDLAHYSLGNAFSMQGDLAGAEKQYRSAIILNNSSATYYIALGRVLRERDALLEAISFLKKAIDLEPRNIDAEFELALAYSFQRENEKARRLLEDVTARDPGKADAHRVLGLVCYRLKLPGEGAKQIAIAADLSEKARQGGKGQSTPESADTPSFR
jgi:superkiller protein 3